MKNLRYVVTGGAGFIGSHIVDRLISEGHEVVCIDNMTSGFEDNIQQHLANPKFGLLKFDLGDLEATTKAFEGADAVFHLAANADIRRGLEDNFRDIDRNLITTYNVLEAMRKNDINKILFSSTAAVYGEPEVFPTPEHLHQSQTSFYGASKMAAEALIEAFCVAYDFQTWMFRFVSLQGERHPHGVTFDFVKKLKQNPGQLEILGDGSQRKSYLYIGDCLDGFFLAFGNAKEKVNLFNIGHTDHLDVTSVADIITSEMGLDNVEYQYTGGKRGWVGDSPFVHLDISKLQGLGWAPELPIEETIRRTVRWLLENPYVYG